MFELLNQIREQWNNGELIIVTNQESKESASKIMLPTQAVNIRTMKTMITNSLGDCEIVLSDEFCRNIGLPLMSVVQIGLGSRYLAFGKLLTEESKEDPQSLSISLRNDAQRNLENLVTISQNIGDMVDNYSSKKVPSANISQSFFDKFISPGQIRLVRCSPHGLLSQNRFSELGLALAQIANQAPTVLMATLLEQESENEFSPSELSVENLTKIDAKLIFDLWRSINKIQKEDIKYLQ